MPRKKFTNISGLNGVVSSSSSGNNFTNKNPTIPSSTGTNVYTTFGSGSVAKNEGTVNFIDNLPFWPFTFTNKNNKGPVAIGNGISSSHCDGIHKFKMPDGGTIEVNDKSMYYAPSEEYIIFDGDKQIQGPKPISEGLTKDHPQQQKQKQKQKGVEDLKNKKKRDKTSALKTPPKKRIATLTDYFDSVHEDEDEDEDEEEDEDEDSESEESEESEEEVEDDNEEDEQIIPQQINIGRNTIMDVFSFNRNGYFGTPFTSIRSTPLPDPIPFSFTSIAPSSSISTSGRTKVEGDESKDVNAETSADECQLCNERKKCATNVPCGHITFCITCAKKYTSSKRDPINCTRCNKSLTSVVRIQPD